MERCDVELSLKKAHINYGTALLKIYLFWLKDQKDIICRIESFCSSSVFSPWFGMRVGNCS